MKFNKWISLALALIMVCSMAAALADDTAFGAVDQQTYPLTEEKVTLTMWYPNAGSMGELADFNDGEFWQWLEEKTNVHIDFMVPPSGSERENFNLLFAQEKMPDIIVAQPASYVYRDGMDAAIEDGYFLDIAEHLDWCPNYVSWMDNLEYGRKDCYTDSGKMYGLWGF